VHAAAAEAVERARVDHEPAFLECLTYRHYGHSKSDPGAYRTTEEVATWRERDPLTVSRGQLLELGLSETEADAIEAEARAAMDAATEWALASPYPDPATDRATEYAA
jgi:TPP-dependent pyruvate/acetoin dehydrogenase alpha subunit